MAVTHRDARSWAEARSASESPRLGMLEAIACQAYPDVAATFGDDGAAIATLLAPPPPPSRRGPARLGVLLAVIGILAPVAGVAVLGAESYLIDRVGAEVAVPFAGVLFALGALTVIVIALLWWRGGARWSGVICGFDRNAALHILAEKGFLDDEILDRALSAPLGTLFALDSAGAAPR